MCPRVDFIRLGYRNAARRRGEITTHLLCWNVQYPVRLCGNAVHSLQAGLFQGNYMPMYGYEE
jgi:hypothetical protein